MRYARLLRNELDLWYATWRQVETFLDRVNGAADQDGPHRVTCEAMLRIARVIEHYRVLTGATGEDDKLEWLNDPVIDGPADWSPEATALRLPGLDAIELAAASVVTDRSGETVLGLRLPASLTLFSMPRGDDNEWRDPGGSAADVTIQVPHYPFPVPATVVFAQPVFDVGGSHNFLLPPVADPKDGLFSMAQRYASTMLGVDPDLDEAPEEWFRTTWPQLTGACRVARREAGEIAYVGTAGAALWGVGTIVVATRTVGVDTVEDSAGHDAAVLQLVRILSGQESAPVGYDASRVVLALAGAAQAAAATLEADKADLELALAALEDEGHAAAQAPTAGSVALQPTGNPQEDIGVVMHHAEATRSWISALHGSARRLQAALEALHPLLAGGSSTARSQAVSEVSASHGAYSTARHTAVPSLLTRRPESGPLGTALIGALDARLGYPDGTLRVLRTMEGALRAYWPMRRRWFKQRLPSVLEPLLGRALVPFLDGLGALVWGGQTGLDVSGLTVDQRALEPDVAVGSSALRLDAYGSLLSAVRHVEPGRVAVLAGDRPTAALILGFGATSDNRLEAAVAPLRISVAGGAGVAGTPGTVRAGVALETRAPGLSTQERTTGYADAGPEGDGLVETAVHLWSRLCLLRGSAAIAAALDRGGQVAMPSPSGSTPLHSLAFQGTVPPRTRTLVLRGQGATSWAAFWDRGGEVPEPRVARRGELLLLRGTDELGQVRQGVVEVQSVLRITPAQLGNLDLSGGVAQLSASGADVDPATGSCDLCRSCGPQEDLVMLVLADNTVGTALVRDISLRRDFHGFDAPSLAADALLPRDLLADMGIAEPAGLAGIDRSDELVLATRTLTDWLSRARGPG